MEKLEGLLKFDSLDAAEKTLREVHACFAKCQSRHDNEGKEQCRALILKGKRRASMISQNAKVSQIKRQEKAEIAQWFTVWLQTPDLFWEWLQLRKASADFQRCFDSSNAS
jgi:hypothetical protein